MSTIVPEEISPYLSEIAERLWSGHASIMIGAGFSMNAKKVNERAKRFPSWNNLGDCFYKKLHNKLPSDKDRCYLDVLKLANEVQAAFGRSTLDKILIDEIPDKEFQPSDLHEKLLRFPWTDVFTTNYDTLLERTAEKILEQRYETVINKDDLVWSTKPRIIKLHGSFPSERPFIITEEDYRKYPKEFAPFVNTVQQSLLENTLCLIGFSGNDPNFLNWIGWIRDNLGKENSPKIFLIGILSLSVGQKKLLEERNIIPIDLSCFSKTNHYAAFSIFFDYLLSIGKVDNKLNWPSSNQYFHIELNKEVNPQYKRIIESWEKERIEYPNWIVTPRENRLDLRLHTENSFIYHLEKIESPLDVNFLYEFNWRLEKLLQPIFNNWIEFYEKVTEKYNPFPLEITTKKSLTPDKDRSLDWGKIKEQWIELQLSVLRFYREEGINDKWTLLNEKLIKIEKYFSPEINAKYHYERCLYYLFSLDIFSVEKELGLWTSDFSLPYWEAKRAALMAELGNVIDAENILESSLKEVRSRLNLSPVTNDYYLVSQEAYILQILRDVKRSVYFSSNIREREGLDTKEYTERWNLLIQYKCDPWGELDSFENFLAGTTDDYKTTEQKYQFEIGKTSITRKSGYNKYVTRAYEYLRYREEVGLPFKLPSITMSREGLNKAVSCIASYSPNWGFITFIRIEDIKYIDFIWGRKALSLMDWKQINIFANMYLSILEKAKIRIEKNDNLRGIYITLAKVIPVILSRLCLKCDYKTKLKTLTFLQEIYLSKSKYKYGEINKLTQNLINSFSKKEQIELIPKLLEFPIIEDKNTLKDFPDPLNFININALSQSVKSKLNINSLKINSLIEELSNSGNSKSERYTIIHRLVLLWKNGLLTQSQIEKFAKNLWKNKDSNGFPINTNFYYFAFLKLPHPKGINPKTILKKYINKVALPIQATKGDESISFYNGDIAFFSNIIGTAYPDFQYLWEEEELNKLLREIINWWNLDKQYLKQKDEHLFGSVANEFKDRFRNMIKIFSNIINPKQTLLKKELYTDIKNMLLELEDYDFPDLEMKVSCIDIFSDMKNDILTSIYNKLCSKNKEKIFDAINAILILSEREKIDISKLLECVSQSIRIRTEVELNRFIDLISIILRNNSNFYTTININDIEIGLSYLINESKILEDDTDEDVHNKLLCRRSIARLTIILENIIKKRKEVIPKYIKDWKDSCLDKNEFSEIRNIWLNGVSKVLN